MKKILVIEDEEKVLEIVKNYLNKEGFDPIVSSKGIEGLDMFFEYSPDLVVLDLMLPDMTGEEICKKIKSESDTPVIMLTAKSTVDERIKGLSLGADDYLIKPFSPRELMMRIKVILKRYGSSNSLEDSLSFNNRDLVIDKKGKIVFKENMEISLTPAEYKLLSYMAENKNINLSRNIIIQKVFGIEYDGYDRTIDAHIKNIRKKIEKDPKNPIYIITVFGLGYRFEGELDKQ
ncbi:MAG TPA: DNA-binding response regulator [Clostridiales bacterium]|jgi:two-component system OmpR family response regulator|nr:DNA-binding response regulator [Clostridiales bacterium]